MSTDLKTAREIADVIKEQATLSVGPWPHYLDLFIFGTKAGWKCGLSPMTQASDIEYREANSPAKRQQLWFYSCHGGRW
jgi:hypothetical protein